MPSYATSIKRFLDDIIIDALNVNGYAVAKESTRQAHGVSNETRSGSTDAFKKRITCHEDGIKHSSHIFGKETQATDAAYRQTVADGDMQTAQEMVDAAAETAIPDSKARNADGQLIRF